MKSRNRRIVSMNVDEAIAEQSCTSGRSVTQRDCSVFNQRNKFTLKLISLSV